MAVNLQFDVVLHLPVLEHVKWSSLRDEHKGSELELTLNREVLDSKVVLPIVSQRLVE